MTLHLVAVGLLSALGSGLVQAASESFDRCVSELAEPGAPADAYMCFYFAAQRSGDWEGVAARLRTYGAEHPRNHWLELVRGHVERRFDEERAKESYRAAASGFSAERETEGEILARTNLRNLLQRQGRLEAAASEVARVRELGLASGRADLRARALLLEATHLSENGLDLGKAHRRLRQAEPDVFPDGSLGLERQWLSLMGNVSSRLGRFDDAIEAYRGYQALLGDDELVAKAEVLHNLANNRLKQLELLPKPGGRDDVLELAREGLRAAEAASDLRMRAALEKIVAGLLRADPARRDEAMRHAEACVSLARELGHPERIVSCLWTRGDLLAEQDPEAARRDLDEAVDLALASGNPRLLAYAWRSRARAAWESERFERARAISRQGLETVESLRSLQEEDAGRAALFSDWTVDYYLLSGRLLQAVASGRSGDVDAAFEVMERMRSRVLLEQIQSMGSREVSEESAPLEARRRALLESISGVQRRLLDPALEAPERERSSRELEALEIDYEEVAADLRRSDRRYAMREPEIATLPRVRAALDENQALLAFQVSLWKDLYGDFGGGAWAVLVTPERSQVFPIPDRSELVPLVPIYLGLVARRDGSEEKASARLYDRLLHESMAALPERTRELVIVPDDVLHRLPFASLRESPDGAPLGARLDLSVAPSATLWLRFRETGAAPATRGVLALADPDVGAEGPARERNLVLREGLELGALPHARDEARAIARHLGEAADVRIGAEASEAHLKATNVGAFAVLHFAAHAVADEERPERSAVVLSPGAETEDGLLQAREIGDDLRLDGRAVVLSACRTAAGELLGGEGVLSLSRSFFEAGAHAVIGSRWPLRDDEAAFLFDRFYAHLAEGASLARALRRTRAEAMDEGLPTAAWGSLVLLGDGDASPVSPRARRRHWMFWALVLALAGAAGASARVMRARWGGLC